MNFVCGGNNINNSNNIGDGGCNGGAEGGGGSGACASFNEMLKMFQTNLFVYETDGFCFIIIGLVGLGIIVGVFF